ncbi:AN1-type zinc finger domain-containing protein [Saliphagus sp. GCM10025334]
MTRCHVCHEPLNLPNDCNYCSEYYCSEHRLPENHDCPNLDKVHTLGPEFRETTVQPANGDGVLTPLRIGVGILVLAILVATFVLFL